jgi:adenylate cyclase
MAACDPRASLAVVPFSDGDDVIAAFAGLATWVAVSKTTRLAVRTPADLRRIGETIGARYILHGWTETERDRLRLTVELNEAESGRMLWSDQVDRPRTEQMALHDEAIARIGRAVPPLLLQRELDRSALARPESLVAHDLALLAFAAIMRPRRDTFAEAATMLIEAAGKTGPLGSTRFALVWWHIMANSQGWSTDLEAAAEICAGLDRDDPAAMALLVHTQSLLRRDHATALAMLDRVLEIAPQCGLACSLKALTLCWLGEAQAAVGFAERASVMPALGPERAWRDHVTALAHYLAGRYGDAVLWARVSAKHHSGLAANLRVLGASLAVLGRLDEAQQAAGQSLAIYPDFRIEAWRQRSMLPEECRDTMARRLRLAGLPA